MRRKKNKKKIIFFKRKMKHSISEKQTRDTSTYFNQALSIFRAFTKPRGYTPNNPKTKNATGYWSQKLFEFSTYTSTDLIHLKH